MSTQNFAPMGSYTVHTGTDGWSALGPDGGERGPFDRAEDALQAAIDACAVDAAGAAPEEETQ